MSNMVLGAVIASMVMAPADATTLVPGQTLKVGTKINCVLDENVNSQTLKAGTDFKLRVNDPSYPALEGAEVHGHVTDVTQPAGLDRARIAFLFDYIHLRNGTKEPIRAYVVSKNVVQYNPAASQSTRRMPPPAVPYGTVTPGPIAWQMRIGGGSPSVASTASGATGGYVYAQKSNEPIVIRSGAPVTIELASSLRIP